MSQNLSDDCFNFIGIDVKFMPVQRTPLYLNAAI